MRWSQVLNVCWKLSIGNARWFIGAIVLANIGVAGNSPNANFSFISNTSGFCLAVNTLISNIMQPSTHLAIGDINIQFKPCLFHRGRQRYDETVF